MQNKSVSSVLFVIMSKKCALVNFAYIYPFQGGCGKGAPARLGIWRIGNRSI